MITWRQTLPFVAFLLGCHSTPDLQQTQQPKPALEDNQRDGENLTRQLEQFAGVRLPSSAQSVRVTLEKNTAGNPVYRAQFTTSERDARAFCSDGGLGGAQLRSQPLDPKTRDRFGLSSEEASAAFGCKASSPAHPQIERQVLVTLPSTDAARVHLIAFRVPPR